MMIKVTDPDTGEEVGLHLSEGYQSDLAAFHADVCAHDAARELRVFTARNGAKHHRHQCLKCGEAVGQSVPKATSGEVVPSPFDDKLKEDYQKARQAKQRDIIRKHIRLQKDDNVRFSKEYDEHINSEKWKNTRQKVLERAQGLCEGCREEPATAVHHITYDHLGNEFLFELLALCSACHARWHGEEEDQDAEQYDPEELTCSACRFQTDGVDGKVWCGVHNEPSRIALAPDGKCGPDTKSFESLR